MQTHPDFPNLFILNHPLIQHKLSHMRDRNRSTMGFRALLKEIALLMGYEITRDFPMTTERIETPLAAMDAPVLAGKKLAIVPILRAGLGMAQGLHELVPSAREGMSASIATTTPSSRSSIWSSCRNRKAASSCWSIRCWRPAIPRPMPATC